MSKAIVLFIYKVMISKIQNLQDNGTLDRTGAAASFICAIHCVAMPFMIAALPLLGLGFLLDERLDWALISFSVIIGLVSLVPSFIRHHRKVRTLILFIVGISLILISHIWLEEDWHLQAPVLIAGAAAVISAHLINRKLCKSCIACQ